MTSPRGGVTQGATHGVTRRQFLETTVVNGVAAGVGLGRPYRFDVTDHVREGGNRLEVIVYNTLANHYSVGIPSKYVFEGQTVSGLLGPVRLHFAGEVILIGRPVV